LPYRPIGYAESRKRARLVPREIRPTWAFSATERFCRIAPLAILRRASLANTECASIDHHGGDFL
jgi:hypothetical protein